MGRARTRDCKLGSDSRGTAGGRLSSRPGAGPDYGGQDERAGALVTRRLWCPGALAVSSFSTHWLALREPVDASSRAAGLAGLVRDEFGGHSRVEIIDLGAGTGANLRYAAPLLAGAQDWLLVERDPLLLAAMAQQLQAWSHSTQGHFTA